MKNDWFEKKWASFTPLLMLFIFLGIYVIAQASFVECKQAITNCVSMNPKHIFSTPPTPEPFINTDDKSVKSVEVNGKLVKSVEVNGKLIEDENEDLKQIRTVMADRYNGRLVAMFLIAANALFCFIAFFVFFFLIKKSLGDKFAVGVVAVSLLIGVFFGFKDSMPLMEPVLENTIKILVGGMSGILNVIRTLNSIAYAATLAFVFTICSILYSKNSIEEDVVEFEQPNPAPPENSQNPADNENVNFAPPVETDEQKKKRTDLDKKLQNLSNKKGDLETVLYIGTILLVVGVLRMSAMSSWSLTFMTPGTVEIAKTFFAHLTTVIGGFFTLLLIVTYLPAIYILQQHGKMLLEDSAKKGIEPTETSEKTDFTFSLTESLPRIIAIAAPLLTGPIADLLNFFSPK